MKNMKRIGCLLLAMMMAASFWGCAGAGDSDQTTAAPDTTAAAPETTASVPQTTEAALLPDPTTGSTELGKDPISIPENDPAGESLQCQQLRLPGSMSEGWKNAFNQSLGCFAVAADAEELSALLAQKLPGVSPDVSAYDDAFFAENRLVLIPRSSNSGSVRYSAELTREDTQLHITLEGQMPDQGTMDMAEWLVLVAVPYESYDASLTITVPVSGGTPTTGVIK